MVRRSRARGRSRAREEVQWAWKLRPEEGVAGDDRGGNSGVFDFPTGQAFGAVGNGLTILLQYHACADLLLFRYLLCRVTEHQGRNRVQQG